MDREKLPFELLSARATAALGVLQISLTRTPVFNGNLLKDLPDAPGGVLKRTIGTDDYLVRTIISELRNRDVNIGAVKHLVLVGEWDTLYSPRVAIRFAGAEQKPCHAQQRTAPVGLESIPQ